MFLDIFTRNLSNPSLSFLFGKAVCTVIKVFLQDYAEKVIIFGIFEFFPVGFLAFSVVIANQRAPKKSVVQSPIHPKNIQHSL